MATKSTGAAPGAVDTRAWAREAISGGGREDPTPPDPRATSLSCTLQGTKARFVAPDKSFAIWGVSYTDSEGHERSGSIQGDLARVSGGEMLSCEGEWKKHPKHGWGFHVRRHTSALPTTDKGIADWLATRIHGVGPTFARAIVDHFGAEHVYDIIDADPSRLREVRTKSGRKLPEKQVERAIEAWDDVKAIRQIETFLFSRGISSNLAGKLYRKYGPDVVKVLEEEPYRITEISGIGFKIADGVARSMGIALDDPRRVKAAILFALKEAESDGHTFLSQRQIIGHTVAALTPPGEAQPPESVRNPQKIIAAASELSLEGRIVAEDDEHLQQRIYAKGMHRMETHLAQRLRHLLETPTGALFPKPQRPTAPEGTSEEEALELGLPSDAQWSVVDMVRLNRLSILTGSPGSGKCVTGDTPIFVNGTLMTARDVWEHYATDLSWDEDGHWATPSAKLLTNSISADGTISARPFSRLWKQRIREFARRVTLDDGTSLTLTKAHKMMGPDGWTNEIEAGDRVCIPRRLVWKGKPVDADLVTLIAWAIAEGHEPKYPVSVNIFQKELSTLERIRESARAVEERHGIPMNKMSIYRDSRGSEVHRLSINSVALRKWLEDMGYSWGKRSAEKRIPDFIMRADDASVRIFLREFLAAEGSVMSRVRCFEVSSASQEMMGQLAILARRFGIWLRIKEKQKCATNGAGIKRPYWTGYISGPSLRIFAQEVGIADERKELLLQEAASTPSNPNIDVVPFRDLMLELRTITKLAAAHFGVNGPCGKGERDVSLDRGRRVLAAVGGVTDGSAERAYRASRPSGRGGHRYRSHNLDAFASMDKLALADLERRMRSRVCRDVFYAEVISVEDVLLDEDVYDFEVPDEHNYVAAGALCHNTHSQKTLIQKLKEAGKTTRLCAPTGKAARRMQEVTGHPATTIHRLLEYSPFAGGFQRDEDNPIEADCVIIDETSMLSLDLAYSLFRAIGEDTHVLMVGDPDQLAPVGAGKVLDDLIKSERVPRVHLTKIFRQAARSMIIQNSRRLNAGSMPYFRRDEAERALGLDMLNDFFWISRQTPQETAELTLDLACNRLPRSFDLDPRSDIMVLAPMRDGKVGLHYLNSELERRLNHGEDGKPKKAIISRRHHMDGKDVRLDICVGSRIVQTKNDHQNEVMNGELAIVLDYDEMEHAMLLSLDDGARELWLPVPDAESYQLAWALTTHKSQGSEFQAVIVPVSSAHYVMLNRSLYYTAVTRAKGLCVMVGEKKALSMAIKNPDLKKRNSTLAARITDPSLSGQLF